MTVDDVKAIGEELRGVSDNDLADEVAEIAREVRAKGASEATAAVLIEAARRVRRASPQGEAIEGYAVHVGDDGRYFHRGSGHVPVWGVPATLIRHPQGEETSE